MTTDLMLQTDRLILRQPQADDLDAYTAYCLSDRTRFVGGPFTAHKAFDKFASMAGHWTLRRFGRYVMVLDGAAIGHVGPLQMDDATVPEMTWTLWDGSFEGQGFATEAARAVLAHLKTRVAWPRMMIRVQPENSASCRIAEKLGGVLSDLPAPESFPGAVTYWLPLSDSALPTQEGAP